MSDRTSRKRSVLYLAGSTLLGILLLSLVWEFWLEGLIGPPLGIERVEQSARQHWEYVVTSVLFAAIAMFVPTLAFQRLSGERAWISESHRESEEKFRGIVENSPACISLKDADGRYFLINRQFERMSGLTSETIRGKRSDKIFPEDFAKSGMEHDREVLASGQASAREEEFHSSGSSVSFLTVKFPITDAKGEVAAIGAIHTDITEHKRAERQLVESRNRFEEKSHEYQMLSEQLIEARDRSEAANRAKSEFLAMMSHELRTPLNAIIGFSEIIKSEALGPVGNAKYHEFSYDIHASGQHLLELINDILDLSKIESGKVKLFEEDIEMPELIESVLTLVKESANKSDIELASDGTEDLPMLRADRRKVKQILANILANGIKFTPAGGRVCLKAWCNTDSGHVFQITDSGIGIPGEQIPRALAPFQQIDSRLGRQHEGTGLGLPLTKSLVELHGGTFDLQSEVDRGTTVTVRFPASRIVIPRHRRSRVNAL
jgi:PAS domain S-box-containing protein